MRGVDTEKALRLQAAYDACIGALADIAFSPDMTFDMARRKAARIWRANNEEAMSLSKES